VLEALQASSVVERVSGAAPLTILLTVALTAAPALLLGFSIPLLSLYLLDDCAGAEGFRPIYREYNIGAVAGVVLVEFLLVRLLGHRLALWAVAAVSALIGVALIYGRFGVRGGIATQRAADGRSVPRRAAAALAMVGGASAMYQFHFIQFCFHLFTPHRENLAVALAVSLAGIAVGSEWVRRRRCHFAGLLALAGLAVLLAGVLEQPFVHLYHMTLPPTDSVFVHRLAHKLLIATLIGLAPAICFGATVPALLVPQVDRPAVIGRLLLIVSLGNAAGYLFQVTFGNAWFEVPTLLSVIAAGALLAAVVASTTPWRHVVAATVLGGALVAVLFARWQPAFYYAPGWAVVRAPAALAVYRRGPESAAIVSYPDADWVAYNGHYSMYVRQHGRVNMSELASGIIPALTAPRLERAAVLGLGMGITAGASGRLFAHTDVVEINPAFLDMAAPLRDANLAITENPAVTIHLADARTFLRGKTGVYDAIVNSIPAPTYYAASKIYTEEFYDQVVRALRSDGVFCTWLAPPNMTEEGVLMILSALQRRFRHCVLHLVGPSYYMATFSQSPLAARTFAEVAADPLLIDTFGASVAPFTPDVFLNALTLHRRFHVPAASALPLRNTDDHPLLEFMLIHRPSAAEHAPDYIFDHRRELGIDVSSGAPDSQSLLERAAVFRMCNSRFYTDFAHLPVGAAAARHFAAERRADE
jgi:hypothetical protein